MEKMSYDVKVWQLDLYIVGCIAYDNTDSKKNLQ